MGINNTSSRSRTEYFYGRLPLYSNRYAYGYYNIRGGHGRYCRYNIATETKPSEQTVPCARQEYLSHTKNNKKLREHTVHMEYNELAVKKINRLYLSGHFNIVRLLPPKWYYFRGAGSKATCGYFNEKPHTIADHMV